MFRFFETSLAPTAVPDNAEPPSGLAAFYWHFARQAKALFIGLFAIGFVVALLDVMIPVFIGKVVTLVTESRPEMLLATSWSWLLGMAIVLLVLRPAAFTIQHLLINQAIAANVSNRIRWQNHWHVSRQSWTFFQNDFAGRIATRVMQTGPAIRESLVALLTAVWFIMIYGTSSLILLASADRWLALPVLLWFASYVAMLRYFVPRMQSKSKVMSEARSMLTGRIVDTYTNIVTVKLFARAKDEDAYVREAIDHHTGRFHESAQHAVRAHLDNAERFPDHRYGRIRDHLVAPWPRGCRNGSHGPADDHADHQCFSMVDWGLCLAKMPIKLGYFENDLPRNRIGKSMGRSESLNRGADAIPKI